MGTDIHPTAIISSQVELGENVEIGPYSVINGRVVIKDNVKIGPFVHIAGRTFIGEDTKIFTGAAIGNIPQDLKFAGEDTSIVIGKKNIIREYVMINPGTSATGQTIIGDNNLLMAYVHIAHDCRVGNNCIIANVGTLAGHVVLGDHIVIGGLTAIHQFVRIGDFAILGGCSKVVQDVPPYAMVDGHPAKIFSINRIGLKRAGFKQSDIDIIKKAYEILFNSGHTRKVAVEIVESRFSGNQYVKYIISFILSSKRGICRGRAVLD